MLERVEVDTLDAVGLRLYEHNFGKPQLASREELRVLLETPADTADDLRFNLPFLIAEWEDVVDAWQLDSWEMYRDVARLGRKTRLPERDRAQLWACV